MCCAVLQPFQYQALNLDKFKALAFFLGIWEYSMRLEMAGSSLATSVLLYCIVIL